VSWPERYGGGGLTPRHEYIFDQEGGRYELPTGIFSIGLGMCGPTLLAHGTEEQKTRYLPPMLRGEEIWSQIFSEPAAGSDSPPCGPRHSVSAMSGRSPARRSGRRAR